MFDTHIHSHHSHDSRQSVEEICLAAIQKGVRGVAITDHVDMWYIEERNTVHEILQCIEEVRITKEKYRDQLKVLQGIELAEYDFDRKNAQEFLRFTDYDVIIGSVHCVEYADFKGGYSTFDFGPSQSIEKIYDFLHLYFALMKKMIEDADFDVLAHLTCPFRYINGKYHRGIQDTLFAEEIEEILAAIVEKGIALEVNTSGIGSSYGDWLPGEWIISRYYTLGGRLVTIGSDAHVSEGIGNAFEETKAMLRKIGFLEYYYYEKRKPIKVKL